jgi:(E)-4-hydroxy-3-methylbut-2-enyl-diphosphate synthase
VVADFMGTPAIGREDLQAIGYSYDPGRDKWNIGDAAADYVYTRNRTIDFDLPGTLKVILDLAAWQKAGDPKKYLPLYTAGEYLAAQPPAGVPHFVSLDAAAPEAANVLQKLRTDEQGVVCLWSSLPSAAMISVRSLMIAMMNQGIPNPVILRVESPERTIDGQLIHFSVEAGALFLDGMGDGIWLTNLQANSIRQFLNNSSFSILQATRTRISKTEYISCPSCGRTLFDLQETTAKIRAVTHHLKGVKIAIMGCIVNGPGEMADADFGYVGSGPGKITLYKGKEIVKRGVDSSVALEELINLLKEHEVW